MDKIDIILWVISGGFTAGFSLMLVMWHNLKTSMDKIENKVEIIDKDLNQINTRIAVLESKVNDINSTVTHLMWHNQAYPQKDAKEE